MVLFGITREETPVGGGGFSDLYSGTYEGERVALKVLRIFSSMGDAAKVKLVR